MWAYTETELWQKEEGDVKAVHVFGLLSFEQTVLVFAEARKENGGDAGNPHDLYLRRSIDGGRSFCPTEILLTSENRACWGNPVPVRDARTGRIFLFVSNNRDNARTENYVLHSDDGGVTWSAPEQINHVLEAGPDAFPFHLAGPGHGIQLARGEHAGRLLVPVWHRFEAGRPLEERGYCASLIISDDHGKTWRCAGPVGRGCGTNESRVVETKEGLLWLMRVRPKDPARYEARSYDGGETWSEPQPQATGAANNCDAGVWALDAHVPGWENVVLMSRVSELERRWNMEVLISRDDGKTFPLRFAAPPGDATPGYSDLCLLDEDEPTVGLVHCRWNHILFSRVSLDTLSGGRYGIDQNKERMMNHDP